MLVLVYKVEKVFYLSRGKIEAISQESIVDAGYWITKRINSKTLDDRIILVILEITFTNLSAS